MRLLRIACKYIGGTLLGFSPQLVKFIYISNIGVLAYLILYGIIGNVSLTATLIGSWSVLFIDEFIKLLATRRRKK